MSEERNIPDDADLDAAATWLVRLQQADATGDDWLAFEAWLAAAPAHLDAYERVERLSLELDADAEALKRAQDAPPTAPPLAAQSSAERPAPRRDLRKRQLTRRRWMAVAGGAIAAGLAGVLVVTPNLQPWPTDPTFYEAPAGQTRNVRLADGTQVQLNAGSRIAVHLGPAARRVRMTDAEATFDVTHDVRRPFLIQVADREVRVVGTQFNLRQRDGRVVLTVRRGVVEVRPIDDPGARPTRVTVGQQLVHVDGADESIVRQADADEAFGWTTNRLIYRDAPLSEVAADLQRRYARPVRVADAETGQVRFSGVLTLDDEAAVLRRLTSYTPVDARRAADGAVVLQKR
jgi:transmembrane sensor